MTGSSSIPYPGAKKRETKSTSPLPGAVTITALRSSALQPAPCRGEGADLRPPTRTPPGSRARPTARRGAARARPRRRRAARRRAGARDGKSRTRQVAVGADGQRRRWRNGTAPPCVPAPASRRRRGPRPGWRGRRGRSRPPASSSGCCSRPLPPTKNAVSERLFSVAIFCITSSGSQAVSGHTAAGFPVNTPSVTNASMWWMGISMATPKR